MKLYRFSGAEEKAVDVKTLYNPLAAFIVGGSPSLLEQDYHLLEKPGIFTIGLNNVSKILKTTICMTFDDPRCYYRSILIDSSVMKLARYPYNKSEVFNGFRWNSFKNTMFFKHEPGNISDDSLKKDTLVSPHSSLGAALAFSLATNTKTIFLCGCDFESNGYSYTDDKLNSFKSEWNEILYLEQVYWLGSLRPFFEKHGITLIDTSLHSKLGGWYSTCSLPFAVNNICSSLKNVDSEHKPGHILDYIGDNTMKIQVERFEKAKSAMVKPGTGVPVVSALDVRDSGFNGNTFVLLCCCFLHSLAASNPGRKTYLFMSGENDKQREYVKKAGRGLDLIIVHLRPETRAMIPVQGMRGYSTNLRCALHKILSNEDKCIWIDCDTIVNDNLDWMELEADAAYDKNGKRNMIQGCCDLGYTRTDPQLQYSNAGVEFMRLKGLRESGKGDELLRLCEIWSRKGAFDNKASDQNAINAVGVDYISPTWNVTELTVSHNFAQDRELWEKHGRIFHYIGHKKSLFYRDNSMIDKLYCRMALVMKDLGTGIFDFEDGEHWKYRAMKHLPQEDKKNGDKSDTDGRSDG